MTGLAIQIGVVFGADVAASLVGVRPGALLGWAH
jgi:hypothetical protein